MNWFDSLTAPVFGQQQQQPMDAPPAEMIVPDALQQRQQKKKALQQAPQFQPEPVPGMFSGTWNEYGNKYPGYGLSNFGASLAEDTGAGLAGMARGVAPYLGRLLVGERGMADFAARRQQQPMVPPPPPVTTMQAAGQNAFAPAPSPESMPTVSMPPDDRAPGSTSTAMFPTTPAYDPDSPNQTVYDMPRGTAYAQSVKGGVRSPWQHFSTPHVGQPEQPSMIGGQGMAPYSGRSSSGVGGQPAADINSFYAGLGIDLPGVMNTAWQQDQAGVQNREMQQSADLANKMYQGAEMRSKLPGGGAYNRQTAEVFGQQLPFLPVDQATRTAMLAQYMNLLGLPTPPSGIGGSSGGPGQSQQQINQPQQGARGPGAVRTALESAVPGFAGGAAFFLPKLLGLAGPWGMAAGLGASALATPLAQWGMTKLDPELAQAQTQHRMSTALGAAGGALAGGKWGTGFKSLRPAPVAAPPQTPGTKYWDYEGVGEAPKANPQMEFNFSESGRGGGTAPPAGTTPTPKPPSPKPTGVGSGVTAVGIEGKKAVLRSKGWQDEWLNTQPDEEINKAYATITGTGQKGATPKATPAPASAKPKAAKPKATSKGKPAAKGKKEDLTLTAEPTTQEQLDYLTKMGATPEQLAAIQAGGPTAVADSYKKVQATINAGTANLGATPPPSAMAIPNPVTEGSTIPTWAQPKGPSYQGPYMPTGYPPQTQTPAMQFTPEQLQYLMQGVQPQFMPPYQGTLDPIRRYLEGLFTGPAL